MPEALTSAAALGAQNLLAPAILFFVLGQPFGCGRDAGRRTRMKVFQHGQHFGTHTIAAESGIGVARIDPDGQAPLVAEASRVLPAEGEQGAHQGTILGQGPGGPQRGQPAAVAASGEVDLAISSPAALGAQMQAGTIIGLAQTAAEPSRSLPPLPTMVEAGIPGIDARAFWGFGGPAGLSAAIRQRMEAALRAALSNAEIAQRIEGLGIDLNPQGQAFFTQFLSAQIATWGRVVRENNIRPD